MELRKEEEEARRALDIAERKLSENDYNSAKRFVHKAHSLYPTLDGLKQVMMMIDVHISASNKINGEADWYGVLGVDPLADDETVKKQFKKLALLLHPDKNKCNGAEEAFKLVLEAWCLLSDKAKRIEYDRKTNSDKVKQRKSRMQNQPKPHEPRGSSYKPKQPKPEADSSKQPKQPKQPEADSSYKPKQPKPEADSAKQPNPEADSPYKPKQPKTEADWPSKLGKVNTFWTKCNSCKTHCEYVRAIYLNMTLPCPNCGQDFVATEITPEIFNGRPFIRLSPSCKSTSKRKSDTSSSSSASDSLKAAYHKRMKRWFEAEHDASSRKEKVSTFWTMCYRCKTLCKLLRTDYLNKMLSCQTCGLSFVAAEMIPEIINGSPAIRLSTKFRSTSETTENASCSSSSSTTSTSYSTKATNQAEENMKRWFPESVAARGCAKEAKRNSTFEAESLFEKPTTTGNANSSLEAERIFEMMFQNFIARSEPRSKT